MRIGLDRGNRWRRTTREGWTRRNGSKNNDEEEYTGSLHWLFSPNIEIAWDFHFPSRPPASILPIAAVFSSFPSRADSDGPRRDPPCLFRARETRNLPQPGLHQAAWGFLAGPSTVRALRMAEASSPLCVLHCVYGLLLWAGSACSFSPSTLSDPRRRSCNTSPALLFGIENRNPCISRRNLLQSLQNYGGWPFFCLRFQNSRPSLSA
jgi:hypothetical protein